VIDWKLTGLKIVVTPHAMHIERVTVRVPRRGLWRVQYAKRYDAFQVGDTIIMHPEFERAMRAKIAEQFTAAADGLAVRSLLLGNTPDAQPRVASSISISTLRQNGS
jgi:hypothetical protein